MKTILSINKDFFSNVAESIAKYNVNKLNNAPKISNSKDSFDLFLNEFNGDIYDTEKFYVMYLNNNNSVLNIAQISSGGITGTVVDMRLVFRHAFICKATSMLLCHNHPSGTMRPSQADKDLTVKIKSACKVLDINLLDHIIISSEKSYYSFADEGLI
jgi:DNA repair protein RadC